MVCHNVACHNILCHIILWQNELVKNKKAKTFAVIPTKALLLLAINSYGLKPFSLSMECQSRKARRLFSSIKRKFSETRSRTFSLGTLSISLAMSSSASALVAGEA